MADNYLERRYDEYLAEKAKRTAWKKRLDAYRKHLAETAPITENSSKPEIKKP